MTNDTEVSQRLALIRCALENNLSPVLLEVSDESHLHVGHAGARSGKGHFHVKIASTQFIGLSLIKRHRLVYAALDELMVSDIHALGIDALAPNEIDNG